MNDSTPQNIPSKLCCRCKSLKPATREYFYADKRNPDGLYGCCKECHKLKGRERYVGERREKTLAAVRQRVKLFPDQRKATHKRYYWKNREKILQKNALWERSEAGKRAREKKKEARQIYQVHYRRRQRHLIIVTAARREARKKLLPSDFTLADWQFALDYFGGCCAVCGRPPGLWHTLAPDHWIALASPDCPGTIPRNIIPLCHGEGGCNNAKQDRDAKEWLTRKFGKKRAATVLAKIDEYFALI